jgi:hypothetical protein
MISGHHLLLSRRGDGRGRHPEEVAVDRGREKEFLPLQPTPILVREGEPYEGLAWQGRTVREERGNKRSKKERKRICQQGSAGPHVRTYFERQSAAQMAISARKGRGSAMDSRSPAWHKISMCGQQGWVKTHSPGCCTSIVTLG